MARESLFQAMLDVGSEWGSSLVIVGDFNACFETDAVLATAVASGRWYDWAKMAAARDGSEPSCTCFRPGASPTRIDGFIANGFIANRTVATAMMVGVAVRNHLLPTNRAVTASFS